MEYYRICVNRDQCSQSTSEFSMFESEKDVEQMEHIVGTTLGIYYKYYIF